MTDFRPRRSALYMPGSNARAIDKARSLAADVIILDLEDAVAPDAKAEARQRIRSALDAGGFGDREMVVRINGLATPWGEEDLAAVVPARPAAILLPKVETADDIVTASKAMTGAGAPADMQLWAMMETPLAVLKAAEIAAASRMPGSRLSLLLMGTNDLVKETRAELDAQRTAALHWLATCLLAARAHGLDIIDGVYNNFRDLDGLEREARQGRMLGFDGKSLIHPDQIAIANATFGPAPDEVAEARRIIAAFEAPEAKGKGVIKLDGRMVELLHAAMARRVVAIADAIGKRR